MSVKLSEPLSQKYSLLLYAVPLLLFIIAATILYPFYQYRIISDDISYLEIASRYIRGDYARAINGYWSPLNIWLLALLVKATGWPLLVAAYGLNCLSFAGILLLSIQLCRRLVSSAFEVLVLGCCAALFWAGNIPVTHFADALNCMLLLVCLFVLLRSDFMSRPLLWIAYGLLSAITYFSKAYSFYILPLSTAILLVMLLRHQDRFAWSRWIRILAATTGSMLLFSLPWLWLLHQKYGHWLISTAGSINTSWAIEGHMYFSTRYSVLVPPAQPDGLSCWEDPWINHGDMRSPFGSLRLLAKQLFRIAVNIPQWFKTILEYSPLYFPIWLAGLLYLIRKPVKQYHPLKAALIFAFFIFPVGYIPLSFGTRYLWFTVPLVMITGLWLLQEYLKPQLSLKLYRLLILVYGLTWLPGVVLELKATFNEGKADHAIAQQLKEQGIKGSFLTNNYAGYQHHFRISWFSRNPFYMHFGDQWTTAELLQEAARQQVSYYYYFYEGSNDDYVLRDATGKAYPEVTGGKIDGLKVFRLR